MKTRKCLMKDSFINRSTSNPSFSKKNNELNSAIKSVVSSIALTSSLFLGACSNFSQQHAETESVTSDKSMTIGVNIYRSDDLFIKGMANEYEAQAKDYGNVNTNVQAAQNKQDVQNSQIDKMLAENNDALLINLVNINKKSESAFEIVNKAKNADVPVIFFNRDPGSKILESYDKAYYVGSIPAQSGLLQGELVVADWLANPSWDKNKDGSLQYLVLKGEIGHADAEGRTKWAQATIQNYPDKGITADSLAVIGANWQREEAKAKLAQWLDSSPNAQKLEVIIANNDGMALGAIDLLKERRLKIPVYGVDAVPEALNLIKTGEMAGTILQDVKGQVSESLKLSINLANDKARDRGLDYKVIEKHLMVPYVAINQKNVDQYM